MAWVAPRAWAVAEALTAAKMNEISSSLNAVGDPWTAYATTWGTVSTAPSLGNGILSAAYRETGKTVDYRIVLTLGSSSTVGTGGFTFTAPTPFASDVLLHHPLGRAVLFDTSTGNVYGRSIMVFGVATQRVVLRDEGGTAASGTVPFTFASGDRIMIQGVYERS